MPEAYMYFIMKCLDFLIKYIKKISKVTIILLKELYLFSKKIIITKTIQIVKKIIQISKIPFTYTPIIKKEKYDKLKSKEKIKLDINRDVQPGQELIKYKKKGR